MDRNPFDAIPRERLERHTAERNQPNHEAGTITPAPALEQAPSRPNLGPENHYGLKYSSPVGGGMDEHHRKAHRNFLVSQNYQDRAHEERQEKQIKTVTARQALDQNINTPEKAPADRVAAKEELQRNINAAAHEATGKEIGHSAVPGRVLFEQETTPGSGHREKREAARETLRRNIDEPQRSREPSLARSTPGIER